MKNLLTVHENECIVEFMAAHKDCHRGRKCGRWSFAVKLSASGIGQEVRVKCCSCKKKLDVSDVSIW